MKKLTNILLTFLVLLIVSISSVSAQTTEQVSYNKEYNDVLYLTKTSWNYLETSGASRISIYNAEGHMIKTKSFKSTKYNRDIYMDFIMFSLYNLNDDITKITIDTKTIDIKYNNITSDFNKSILDCINDHVVYCKNQRDVSHTQGEKTYEQRLDDCDITGSGLVSENCAKTYGMGSVRMDIRRTFLAYYKGKNMTAHWNAFMDTNFKIYTTSIVKGPAYTYSVTIFTEYKTDKI